MPWVALITTAASMLDKQEQERKARRNAADDVQLDIARDHAQSFGNGHGGTRSVHPAESTAGSNIGAIIQALSSMDKGGDNGFSGGTKAPDVGFQTKDVDDDLLDPWSRGR